MEPPPMDSLTKSWGELSDCGPGLCGPCCDNLVGLYPSHMGIPSCALSTG